MKTTFIPISRPDLPFIYKTKTSRKIWFFLEFLFFACVYFFLKSQENEIFFFGLSPARIAGIIKMAGWACVAFLVLFILSIPKKIFFALTSEGVQPSLGQPVIRWEDIQEARPIDYYDEKHVGIFPKDLEAYYNKLPSLRLPMAKKDVSAIGTPIIIYIKKKGPAAQDVADWINYYTNTLGNKK